VISKVQDFDSMTGYSGTPLAKKLGIKPSTTIFVSGAPENYVQLVSPLPEGVHLVQRLGSETDMVHVFVTKRAVALPMGLVDIKVCAVDDMWSGLKLALRKEKRRSR
jgi:hypothetical protein